MVARIAIRNGNDRRLRLCLLFPHSRICVLPAHGKRRGVHIHPASPSCQRSGVLVEHCQQTIWWDRARTTNRVCAPGSRHSRISALIPAPVPLLDRFVSKVLRHQIQLPEACA
jgi:hypothetical protein